MYVHVCACVRLCAGLCGQIKALLHTCECAQPRRDRTYQEHLLPAMQFVHQRVPKGRTNLRPASKGCPVGNVRQEGSGLADLNPGDW